MEASGPVERCGRVKSSFAEAALDALPSRGPAEDVNLPVNAIIGRDRALITNDDPSGLGDPQPDRKTCFRFVVAVAILPNPKRQRHLHVQEQLSTVRTGLRRCGDSNEIANLLVLNGSLLSPCSKLVQCFGRRYCLRIEQAMQD
jgi:hypothetical protein